MTGTAFPSRSEQGFSLVESVVAVAILGFIVAAMVGGMATVIATSDIHRQESEANAVMVSAAETVKQLPYAPCARAYLPPVALPSARWAGAGVITASVKSYWQPRTSTWDTICHDTDGSSLFPMQLVTITVADPGQRATVHVDIVKRGP